jgi:hypothetical protein
MSIFRRLLVFAILNIPGLPIAIGGQGAPWDQEVHTHFGREIHSSPARWVESG